MRKKYFEMSGRRIHPLIDLSCLGIASVMIAACSGGDQVGKLDPFAGNGSPYYQGGKTLPKGGGRRQVGKPYTVAGRTFYPKLEPNYEKVGMASWYGPKFNRRKTSNGEWFDMDYRSAAHATMPLPSYAEVENLENGRSMVVRVNDRGPFVGTRIIDLSKKSAEILGYKNKGKAKVKVTYIGPAPLNDKGSHLDAINRAHDSGLPTKQLIAAADSMSNNVLVAKNSYTPQISAAAAMPNAYFVQAGSFANQSNAAHLGNQLSSIANTQVNPVDSQYGALYQVRLGPWDNPNAANNALQQVVSAGYGDAHIVTAK